MFPFGEGFQFDWYVSDGSQPAIIFPLFPFHLTLEVNGSKHNLNIEIQEKNMWTIVSSMVSSSKTSILERILLDNFQTFNKSWKFQLKNLFGYIQVAVWLAVCLRKRPRNKEVEETSPPPSPPRRWSSFCRGESLEEHILDEWHLPSLKRYNDRIPSYSNHPFSGAKRWVLGRVSRELSNFVWWIFMIQVNYIKQPRRPPWFHRCSSRCIPFGVLGRVVEAICVTRGVAVVPKRAAQEHQKAERVGMRWRYFSTLSSDTQDDSS